MRRILSFPILILSLGFLAVALLLPGLAAAEPLTIATGKAGGGYDRRAIQIEQRLEQRGIEAQILNLNGSDEISLAVCAGRAGLGILQIDAIYARSLEGCQMKAVASYGAEVALLLFPPRAQHDELSDLGPGSALGVFWARKACLTERRTATAALSFCVRRIAKAIRGSGGEGTAPILKDVELTTQFYGLRPPNCPLDPRSG